MTKRFQQSLYLLLALFMALFIVSAFWVRAKYIYSVYGDTPVLERQQTGLLLLWAIIAMAASCGLYRLGRMLAKFSPKIIIPVILLSSLAVQIAVIFAFPRLPTDDSQTVLNLALDMLYRNDYSSFQTGGYLHMFPFNFSTVLYLKTLLQIFPDNYVVLKLFNMLFMLVTTLIIYLLYGEISGKTGERNYGVLLLAAFYVPAVLMSNFIYNDIIATACLTSALYFAVRFMNRPSLKFILASAVLLALGNAFRSIGAIFLIAIVLCLLLRLHSTGLKKTLIALGIISILFNVPGWTQNAVLQATGAVDESVNANSAPVYMWLNMGVNQETFGFWDNRASYNIYQREAGYNKEVSAELFKDNIRSTLTETGGAELVRNYYKKLIWTWTEGTYQMERYGIGNDGSAGSGRGAGMLLDRYSYTTYATDAFAGGSLYRTGLIWFAYTLNLLMYAGVLFRLISSLRAGRTAEIPLVLVILGFVAFYLLWEIKSRYLFPVYPLLIVLSCMGFKDLYHYMIPRMMRGTQHAHS
ncbi:glycosyltransferase family 39 protein [Paenibacillus tengchongensis]|uniref:glycosyltransferase family 39 protein n=1 Tax=Paenibacillus tengchongensis TaxID=2608684 RepID=UPI00124EDB7D|nr:glycosyltransferase family 39 protein [Paenibacillus tengchongensis]